MRQCLGQRQNTGEKTTLKTWLWKAETQNITEMGFKNTVCEIWRYIKLAGNRVTWRTSVGYWGRFTVGCNQSKSLIYRQRQGSSLNRTCKYPMKQRNNDRGNEFNCSIWMRVILFHINTWKFPQLLRITRNNVTDIKKLAGKTTAPKSHKVMFHVSL